MKKFLPKTTNNPQGFTLIELMVVISIIAVLSVVAIGVYTGAQGGARDARRREELDSIAKNIESTKDPVTGYYRYTTTLSAKDYPSITTSPFVPVDVLSTYEYCIAVGITTTYPALPTAPNGGNWQGLCSTITTPATTYYALGSSVTGGTAANEISDANLIKSWRLCATLERSSSPYCIVSLGQ